MNGEQAHRIVISVIIFEFMLIELIMVTIKHIKYIYKNQLLRAYEL